MTQHREHGLFNIYSYPHGQIPQNWIMMPVCLFLWTRWYSLAANYTERYWTDKISEAIPPFSSRSIKAKKELIYSLGQIQNLISTLILPEDRWEIPARGLSSEYPSLNLVSQQLSKIRALCFQNPKSPWLMEKGPLNFRFLLFEVFAGNLCSPLLLFPLLNSAGLFHSFCIVWRATTPDWHLFKK